MTFAFNAREVAPDAGRPDPMIPGWQKMMIESTEIKITNGTNGPGKMLVLVAKVFEGGYTNRKVYINMNIENPNPKTVEIARGQLSAICHATGLLDFQHPDELKLLPFWAKLKVIPASGSYDAKNDVTMYKAIDDPLAGPIAEPGAPGAAPASVPPARTVPPPAARTVPPPAARPAPVQGQAPARPAAQAPVQGAAPAGQVPARPVQQAQPQQQTQLVAQEPELAQQAWAEQEVIAAQETAPKQQRQAAQQHAPVEPVNQDMKPAWLDEDEGSAQ